MDRILKITPGEKRIRTGYIVAFLLLLLSYGITQYANKRLVRQAEMMEHTNKVINNLELILSKVKDAETGVRGYLITKNLEFLYPYYGSREAADSIYHLLLGQTSDNYIQHERIKRLKKSIDRRFEIFSQSLRVFNENNQTLTDPVVSLQPESKRVMDEIRMTVAMMQREENFLLAERDGKLRRTFNTLNTINIISLVLTFALVVFGFITYFRESRARKTAMKRVRDYQLQLNNRIDQLNRANEQLIKMRSQEKFAATGRIARTIAHEVRNPLTNINLAAEQLQSEMSTRDENTDFLFEMIRRNSHRINQLISDLLNSTKFSELAYEKIPVNDLLDEVLREAADRIALTEVKVTRNYSSDTCDILADKIKLKIAFLNLIINALEAMENRAGAELVIATKGEHNKCIITITDNGSGMDAESVSRLFEPYFTTKPKGNGLGLTNTQNIILNHKGEIAVESVPGKGTCFTITLDFASRAGH